MKPVQPLLLDTHIWLWLATGDTSLKPAEIQAIEHAVEYSSVYISVISIWEVAMLVHKQRIVLQGPTLPWIRRAISGTRVVAADLTPEIAVSSVELSSVAHSNPADRIIMATAQVLGATLMTRDQAMLATIHTAS